MDLVEERLHLVTKLLVSLRLLGKVLTVAIVGALRGRLQLLHKLQDFLEVLLGGLSVHDVDEESDRGLGIVVLGICPRSEEVGLAVCRRCRQVRVPEVKRRSLSGCWRNCTCCR